MMQASRPDDHTGTLMKAMLRRFISKRENSSKSTSTKGHLRSIGPILGKLYLHGTV